jgi:Cys-rich four helix bundle protein (predicted Tat secretion target)
MNRRELLLGAVAMATVAASSNVFASENENEHMNMNMGEHDHMNMGMAHEHHSSLNDKLIPVASDCVLKADICIQHCIVAMGQGEKELAACAKSASEVIAICTALQQLASAGSTKLTALAKVAMDICKDCEEECKKTDKHPQCKACGEACTACYKECKALVGNL